MEELEREDNSQVRKEERRALRKVEDESVFGHSSVFSSEIS